MTIRKSWRLHAIDPDKFKYTWFVSTDPSKPKETRKQFEERILSDFHHYFPNTDKVDTLRRLQRLVGSSRKVAEWYKEWNKDKAEDALTPDWLPDTLKDQEAWQNALKTTSDLKTKEAGWNSRIAEKSAALKAVVKTVGEERAAYIKTLNNLVIIDRVSVNELPFEDQLVLTVIEDDEERRAKGKKLVKEFKKRLYAAHVGNNFQSPFE
jgi:hypothetical protein